MNKSLYSVRTFVRYCSKSLCWWWQCLTSPHFLYENSRRSSNTTRKSQRTRRRLEAVPSPVRGYVTVHPKAKGSSQKRSIMPSASNSTYRPADVQTAFLSHTYAADQRAQRHTIEVEIDEEISGRSGTSPQSRPVHAGRQ